MGEEGGGQMHRFLSTTALLNIPQNSGFHKYNLRDGGHGFPAQKLADRFCALNSDSGKFASQLGMPEQKLEFTLDSDRICH
jgi:hypothetical protein